MTADPFEPQIFGKYYLVDHIATGGMAEVYRARTFGHGGFEGLFVVKRILDHLARDPAFVEMFVDEAKVSVALQHPHVVRVFDFGQSAGSLFIAMEHVDGVDLRRVLQTAAARGQRMPPHLAAFVALSACKGLHYAHTRTLPDGTSLGLVHRDVSPSNLMVGFEGEVKVLDFGIAQAEINATVEAEGTIKGTYAYMSPEQTRGEVLDARSDVWSLGATLYEMLTGRRAFKGTDEGDTVRRIRELDLAPVRQLVPSVPEALEDVVIGALRPQPSERFPTARAMGEALRKVLRGLDDDALRDDLSAWLDTLLAEEREAIAARLAAGTEAARALHETVGPDPDRAAAAAAVSRQGRLVGALAVALVGLLGVMGALLWVNSHQPEVPEVSVANTGALAFDVTPAAKVFVSGRLEGEGDQVRVEELAPGDYDYRLEAEGHETVTGTVRVTRGGITRVRHTLEEGWGDRAPVVSFRTDPAGAEVWIDGEKVGVTPLDWTGGSPDTSYEVTYRRDGYADRTFSLEGLALEETEEVSQRLRRKGASTSASSGSSGSSTSSRPAATGSLRVVLVGATWAHVYVDGDKLSRDAPFQSVSIPAGSHAIRVVNTASGLEHTEQVTVPAGGSATVRVLAR